MPLKTLPLGCQHSASTGYVQHASYSTIWVSCTVNDKEVWVSSCHASTSKKKVVYMVVDQNSFIPGRPFFANKKFTCAKLSRTPCLSFAGPMLANNTSYEDSLTTCQITPENHGSLLGSLLNMIPSQDRFFLQSLLAHPLQHAL